MRYLTKSLKIFFLTVMMISNPVLAQDDKICFDKETAKQMRKDLLKKDFLESENESLNRSLDLSTDALRLRKDQLDLALEQNDKLAERLRKNSESEGYRKIIWFALGIFATGLAIKGAQELK